MNLAKSMPSPPPHGTGWQGTVRVFGQSAVLSLPFPPWTATPAPEPAKIQLRTRQARSSLSQNLRLAGKIRTQEDDRLSAVSRAEQGPAEATVYWERPL